MSDRKVHRVARGGQNATRLMSVAVLAVLGIGGILLSGSCGNRKYAGELHKIDSLIVMNDSAGALLGSIDSTRVLESRKMFADQWKIISSLADSINDPETMRNDTFWTFVTSYETHDRGLKKLYRKFGYLSALHKENGSQLASLRESVRKDQIPEDSVPFYIAVETLEVYRVQREVELYMADLQRTLHELDSLHPFAPDAVNHYKSLLLLKKTKKR